MTIIMITRQFTSVAGVTKTFLDVSASCSDCLKLLGAAKRVQWLVLKRFTASKKQIFSLIGCGFHSNIRFSRCSFGKENGVFSPWAFFLFFVKFFLVLLGECAGVRFLAGAGVWLPKDCHHYLFCLL